MWLLLYTLSYKNSVLLDFKQFQMMVVLYLSCNFDVVWEVLSAVFTHAIILTGRPPFPS